MTKGRENAADRISDVLEHIRLRKYSGLLSVERSQGSRFEEGEIYVQRGQPVYARSGQMLGQEALIQLLSWWQIKFSFSADEPRPPTNIPVAVTADTKVAVAANLLPPSVRPPLSAHGNIAPRFPETNAHSLTNAGSISGTRPSVVNDTATTPGLEWLIPQKLGQDQDVLALPLTRPQRLIYLLVDGRRTLSDLSRCTRKSLQEIERLLSELQERGLIVV